MILVKKLTKSDITFIREFSTDDLKQQAIVLPKAYIRDLGLEPNSKERGFEIILDLRLYGPTSKLAIRKPRARICKPVSYTHLTLPTNREV